jgi:general secretion pathway protein I
MKRGCKSGCAGFTLLEVLVSTVLLGTVFVAVVGLASQSLRNVTRMKSQESALLHAREKMNEVLLLEELEPATQSGEWSDGYQWQMQITPNTKDSLLQNPTYGLFDIQVVIRWGAAGTEKTYTIATTQWARRVNPNANK